MKTELFLALTLAAGLATASAQEEAATSATEAVVEVIEAEAPAEAAPAEAVTETTVTVETTTVEGPVGTTVETPAAGAENPFTGVETISEEETFRPGVDEPLPLIPDTTLPPNFEALPQGGGFTTGPVEGGTADALRQAIRIREAKTRALEDPAILAEKARADAARTPEGRRTALRNYYTLLYAKMGRLDKSLKPALEKELTADLRRLEQRRVYPSELVEAIQPLPGSRAAAER